MFAPLHGARLLATPEVSAFFSDALEFLEDEARPCALAWQSAGRGAF